MKAYQVVFTAGFSILLFLTMGCQKEETVLTESIGRSPMLISRYVPGPGTSDCLLIDCETAVENAREALMEKAENSCLPSGAARPIRRST
jgi:hypothetical protein